MTEPTTPNYLTASPQAEPVPKKGRKVLRGLGWTAALFVAFSVGMGVNSGSGGSAAGQQSRDVVTDTVTVETTPDVCITALERADEVINGAGDAFGYIAEMLDAIAAFDQERAESNRLALVGVNHKVEGIDYSGPRDACMAAAR